MGCVTFCSFFISLSLFYMLLKITWGSKQWRVRASVHAWNTLHVYKPDKSVYCALLYTHRHQQRQQQPVKEVTAWKSLCLNQMDKVINDYLYINEIMSFRAIQHLFIYTILHPLRIIRLMLLLPYSLLLMPVHRPAAAETQTPLWGEKIW